MTPRDSIRLAAALAGVAVTATGCSERDTGGLQEAPISTDPVIFTDDFNGVSFQFFGDGATFDDFTITVDSSEPPYQGTSSVKIVIPDWPMWTGAAFPSEYVRDLSGYTALTFWARSSTATTFDVVGLGNDNTGESKYTAEWRNLAMTPVWNKYVVPIPLPAKLSLERGMFFFADAVGVNATGVEVWLDDIVFEDVSGITNPRPSMATEQLDTLAGTTWSVTATQTTFSVDGVDQIIGHSPGYFDFASSNTAVATVEADGTIRVVGGGSAEITATFDGMPVEGTVTINSEIPDATSAAPMPTLPENRVISVFSNAYPNRPVDRWSTDWDFANVSDIQIEGDDVKLYELLGGWNGAGIEFSTSTIDAAAMTHVHLDVWSTDGTDFFLKLVDFGPNGVYDPPPGDDSEDEVQRSIATGEWVGIDIPLAEFTGLQGQEHFAQFIFRGNFSTLFVDNIYFHD